MLEAFVEGLATILSPSILAAMFFAVVIGLCIGIIPGIGGIVACALFLPFIFGRPPEIAIAFLVALITVTTTGGAITAILLNVPGTGVNVATILDGFPMTQKGEGGRALGAAVMASTAGGVITIFLAFLMIPLVKPIIMNFKSPEMTIIVLLGLSFVGALVGRARIKGMISGLLGISLSLVGYQGLTATGRFIFGGLFLYEGLGIVAVTIGLFGLAELFDLIGKGQTTIAQQSGKVTMSNVLQGVKDVFTHKWLFLRSALIGYICGVIPGVGGSTASFVAYGQAKETSKNREIFGEGCVEGVIAPESANNAKEAGALLTTMAFGIPGSPAMAILLGGFLLVGVIPGPVMLIEHLPLAFTLLSGIAVANLMGGIICLLAAPYLSKVAFVKIDLLFPILVTVMLGGAFVAAGSVLNFIVVIVFALLGLVMKRWEYSRAALILGFILGKLFEDYFLMSLKVAGPLFFVSPISLLMLAVMVGLFVYPYLTKVLSAHLKRSTNKV